MSPPDGANPGNESDPIGGKNENENCGKKPERALEQARADDFFQKIVESPDEPFQKILRSARDTFHVPCCHPGENDQPERHDPAHNHRICDRETERDGRFRLPFESRPCSWISVTAAEELPFSVFRSTAT